MEPTEFFHTWVEGNADRLVLLLLHGTGGDENSLLDVGRAVAPGSALLGIRGKRSENGLNRYFRRLSEGVFDMPDLLSQTDALARWLSSVQELFWQGCPLVALGYSNGANMAANLLLGGSGALSGAVMLRPNNPREPVESLDLGGTKCLVLSGEDDPLCPPDDGAGLCEVLYRHGALCEYQQVPSGHGLCRKDFELATDFIANHWPSA